MSHQIGKRTCPTRTAEAVAGSEATSTVVWPG
jgi:hypothetical protein